MKKILTVSLSFLLIIPLIFNHSSSVLAEQNEESVEEGEMQVVYEPEIAKYENNSGETFYFVNKDEVVLEVAPYFKQPVVSKVGPRVQIPDGASYTWDYVDTTYNSNVLSNQVSSWLAVAVYAGISATLIGKVSSTFFKGVAGSITVRGAQKVPAYLGKNVWWKVVKYYDHDAYNIYTKYSITLYSNSSRTNQISQWIEIHKGAF